MSHPLPERPEKHCGPTTPPTAQIKRAAVFAYITRLATLSLCFALRTKFERFYDTVIAVTIAAVYARIARYMQRIVI
jgi:hypothetical protein